MRRRSLLCYLRYLTSEKPALCPSHRNNHHSNGYIMKNIVILFLLATVAQAELRHSAVIIPVVFSDNMVLQQNANVPFWGKAVPGTKVTVKTSWGKIARTVVKADSLWDVRLATLKAGGPFEVTIIVGDSVVTYKNVMLGEVWLCSGQSNMEIPLEGWPPGNPIQNSEAEIEQANYPDIRLFTVTRAVSISPEFDCAGRWIECNSKTAAKFSAAAYFFGRKLHAELKVPIGLIFSSWGGTKIQSWISGAYLREIAGYKSTVDKISSDTGEVKKLNAWIRSHPGGGYQHEGCRASIRKPGLRRQRLLNNGFQRQGVEKNGTAGTMGINRNRRFSRHSLVQEKSRDTAKMAEREAGNRVRTDRRYGCVLCEWHSYRSDGKRRIGPNSSHLPASKRICPRYDCNNRFKSYS